MNRKQKIVILVGTLLILLSGLFPPYVGVYAKEGDNWEKFLGYHFLFSPPSQEYICGVILQSVNRYSEEPTDRLGERLREFQSRRDARLAAPNCSASIEFSRFGVQIIVVLLASVGGIVLFSKGKA